MATGEGAVNLIVLIISLLIIHNPSEFIYSNTDLVKSNPHLGELVASIYPHRPVLMEVVCECTCMHWVFWLFVQLRPWLSLQDTWNVAEWNEVAQRKEGSCITYRFLSAMTSISHS